MTFRQWVIKETGFTWDEWIDKQDREDLEKQYTKFCDNLKTIPVWDK